MGQEGEGAEHRMCPVLTLPLPAPRPAPRECQPGQQLPRLQQRADRLVRAGGTPRPAGLWKPGRILGTESQGTALLLPPSRRRSLRQPAAAFPAISAQTTTPLGGAALPAQRLLTGFTCLF